MLSTPFTPMTFRINARNFFLTYSQANGFSKQDLAAFLQDTIVNLGWLFIAQETHVDGGRHFHVVFGCTKKWDVRNQSLFDFRSVHPNIQACRDPVNAIQYSRKEDQDPFIHGDIPRQRRKWSELQAATTRAEAEDLIQAISYRDYVINHDRIAAFLEKRFKPVIPEYVPEFTEFRNIPFVCTQWMEQMSNPGRPKSLILWGASKTGKTEWARSVGLHMYFNGMFDMSLWNDDAKYAIFDDFPDWGKFFQYKQFLGSQKQFTVTDKYRPKRTVRWGKPCIVISNTLPRFDDMDWINVNCFVVKIVSNFY